MRLLAVTQVFFGSFLCATVNQANFDNNVALYGNKTANLMELNNVTQNLNSQATEVHYEVPSFLGIRDNDVHEYLKTHHVFEELQTLWQQFQTQQKLSSTADSPAGINLTPEATTTLDLIQKTIRDTFSGEKSLIFESKKLSAFLAKAKKEKKLLMVRSTGKEDSKGNVNAGGNESISAVSPDNVAVTKAIGEVVASYFSQRSISQRLMVNDPALVDPQAPLFMPVLLQVMIGEPVDGSTKETAIPTSGVMFSREAEGRTPGVTHIQATYGHNEGVVNGTVAFDTFYIGKNLVIHPLVQIKRDRLVPASGSTLKRKANEKSMQTKPCLSVEQLQALKKCADAIETYYNEPDGMDIEFVVQQNRVFIVQARPVAHKKSEPSYLKKEFVQTSLPANKIPLIIISAGGGQVQIIDAPESVIVAETINEAYDTFLYKTNNKDGIKTVILGQMAPSMSHEVNMLRGAGKQVVYVTNLDTIKTWLTEVATSPLLIDTQREFIVKFVPSDSVITTVENMDLEERLIKPSIKKEALQFSTPESSIDQGWFTHPIAKKVSLFSAFSAPLSKEQVELLKPENLLPQATIATLMNTIQEADTSAAKTALKTLLFHVARRIVGEKTSKKATIDPDLLAHLSDVFAYMRVTAYEAYQALESWESSQKTPQDMIERLYPTTFLQALISQIPSKNLFVNDYSLGSLLKTEKQEQILAQELKITGAEVERIIQYTKATPYGLTDAVQNSWKSFLKDFSTVSDPAVHNDFARIIHAVTTTDILPLWLNTSFYTAAQQDPEIQQEKTAQDIATTLVQEYKEAESFIAELQKKRTQLNTLTLQAWEDPAKFNKLWREFTNEFVNYFADKQFTDNYAAAPELGKLAALALMQHFVSVFDTSIKTLEASRAYVGEDTDTKKVQNFKTMLDGYFSVLEQWAILLESDTALIKNLLFNKPGTTLQEHLSAIKKMLDTAPLTPNQFIALPEFNVAAAALGSQALWTRSIGTEVYLKSWSTDNKSPTLENFFSLIHQNLLITLSIFTKKAGMLNIPTTELVKEIKNKLEQLPNITLIGITFDNDIFTYFYNRPLQNHSSTFQIIYDTKSKTVTFLTQFLGQARTRWQPVVTEINRINSILNLQYAQNPDIDIKAGKVSFGWLIRNKNQAYILYNLINKISTWTLDEGSIRTFEHNILTDNDIELTEKQKKDLILTSANPPYLFEEVFTSKLSKKQDESFVAIATMLIEDPTTVNDFRLMLLERLLTKPLTNKQKNTVIPRAITFVENASEEIHARVQFIKNLLSTKNLGLTSDQKNTIITIAMKITENTKSYTSLRKQLFEMLLTNKDIGLTSNQRDNVITASIEAAKDKTSDSELRSELFKIFLTNKDLGLTSDQKNELIITVFSFASDPSIGYYYRTYALSVLLKNELSKEQTSKLIQTIFEFLTDPNMPDYRKPDLAKELLTTPTLSITIEQRKELESIIAKNNE
jgi:hypothetical protein